MGNCFTGSQSSGEARRQNRRAHQHRTAEVENVRPPTFRLYLENDPILHPAPGLSVPVSQLTEEEQIKIVTRMGLIATLPIIKFDESSREKLSECVICMGDYELGDELRYLPCLHTYHRVCIDDWLMRSLMCPSCMDELRPASPPAPVITTAPVEDPAPATERSHGLRSRRSHRRDRESQSASHSSAPHSTPAVTGSRKSRHLPEAREPDNASPPTTDADQKAPQVAEVLRTS